MSQKNEIKNKLTITSQSEKNKSLTKSKEKSNAKKNKLTSKGKSSLKPYSKNGKLELKSNSEESKSKGKTISKKEKGNNKQNISDKNDLNSSIKNNNINYHEDYRNFYLNNNSKSNISSNVMTKYEKAAILGKRAQQIACGALPLIIVSPNLTNANDIAEEELRQKKNPFIIQRDLGNGKIESLKVREMIIY